MVFLDEDTCRLTAGVWGGRLTSEVSLNDGVWHHVTPVMAEGQVIDTATTENVVIGAYYFDGTMNGFLNGAIDEVRVYGKALKAEEIGNM